MHKDTPGRRFNFKALGGPFDGDLVPMPVVALMDDLGRIVSKSLVLQNNRGQMGKLSKYFFSIQRRQAIYQGDIQVNPDKVG